MTCSCVSASLRTNVFMVTIMTNTMSDARKRGEQRSQGPMSLCNKFLIKIQLIHVCHMSAHVEPIMEQLGSHVKCRKHDRGLFDPICRLIIVASHCCCQIQGLKLLKEPRLKIALVARIVYPGNCCFASSLICQ